MRRRLARLVVIALLTGSAFALPVASRAQPVPPTLGAAIFVAGDFTHIVDVFNQAGGKVDRWDGGFTISDGFATGDLDGDGVDEILVAGDVTGTIDIFDQAGLRPFPAFNGGFTFADGFATGDLDGDGNDEILVAGDVTGTIDIFDPDGSRPFPAFDGDYTTFDGFATGDLDGDGNDEILVAGDFSGTIDIFDPDGSRPFPAFDGDYTIADGFAVARNAYPDADGDALLDPWETAGVDTDNDGTVDVNLPAMGANPNRKDLYVEVDCLRSDGNNNGVFTDPQDHSHCPLQGAMSSVVQSFANAPVSNPDATTGVQLHIDTGPLYGTGNVITVAGTGGVTGTFGDLGGGGSQINEAGNTIVDWDGGSGATSFYTLKQSNFNAKRAMVFRYALFVHQTNARAAVNDCTSGWAEDIKANDFLVSLGGRADLNNDGTTDTPCWGSGPPNGIDDDGDGAVDEDLQDNVDNDGDCTADSDGDGNFCDFNDLFVDEDAGFSVGTQGQQAGTFMHELGHTIGLAHGGADNLNFKPNYLSVMNYAFQSCQVPNAPAPAVLPGGCDFSRDDLNDLVEALPPGLDECQGLDAGLYGLGPSDWDQDGNNEGVTNCQPPNNANVSVDVNGDSSLGTLPGFDDWDNLFFHFRTVGAYANGVANPIADEPDPQTIEQARKFLADLLAPDLDVTKTGPADAIPGDAINYGLHVANHGSGPALDVKLSDSLPDGSTTSFQLGIVKAGSSTTRTVPFTVSCATPDLTVLTDKAVAEGKDIVSNPVSGTGTLATTVHAPVLALSKTATGAVNAGEAITYTIAYANTGSGDATGAVITDTLPQGVYYSPALDAGSGPAPSSVTSNPDGTTRLTWNIGTVAGGSGPHTIRYTARPSLLFLGGDTVANSAKLTFTNANGCVYPAVTTSSPTAITVVPPTRDPQGLGFWRAHPELLTAEILARIQATDDRFDGADGSAPDGRLSAAEVAAVLVPGGNMDKVLEEQLLGTYLNLATRRINAGTAIESRTADRLGLDNVKEAAEFAIATLSLPVSGNRGRYTDATTVLDEINNNRSEAY